MRRRTKLLLQRLIILAIIIGTAVAIVVFFKPRKQIQTTDGNNLSREYVRTIEAGKTINVVLPENIVSADNSVSNKTSNSVSSTSSPDTSAEKKYTPIISNNETYLIPLQTGDDSFNVLIGYDSEELVKGTPVEVSREYEVTGMPENIRAIYFFKVDNYDYPILLVLGISRKLYYVDTESAYKSGNFKVDGYIDDLPEVEDVHQTTITENGKEYKGAVIVGKDGTGYEFNVNMIGR